MITYQMVIVFAWRVLSRKNHPCPIKTQSKAAELKYPYDRNLRPSKKFGSLDKICISTKAVSRDEALKVVFSERVYADPWVTLAVSPGTLSRENLKKYGRR